MHLIWFATTPAWAWALLRQCDSPAAVISASIFMLGWALQYGFSALWHCWPWVNRSSEILANNLDHVGIFIMIAASYMVPCFTLLSETGQYFAVGLWSFALLGSLQTLGLMGVSRGDRRTIAACYVAQGALVVVSAEEMARKFTTVEMQWALLSLTQYALCALVYAFKRPDLLPLHWGYHECFHFLVCTGSVCTYLTHFNIVSRLAGQTAALGQ
jgi:hemolysin III